MNNKNDTLNIRKKRGKTNENYREWKKYSNK